jgi:chromate reductase
MRTVAVIVGSASSSSINRRLASALERLAADRFAFSRVQIDDLPMFNVDCSKEPPVDRARAGAANDEGDGTHSRNPGRRGE